MQPNLETPPTGTLLSIQVGRVRQMHFPDDPAGTWESGIYKAAVTGHVLVSGEVIDGDAQSDLDNHGGPDNVVLAYNADHYPRWRGRLNLPHLAYGNFGENFTVTGFSDETVCIGDIWQVGPELLLQVTQARQPCFKLALRIGTPEIVKLVRETGHGGWYLRVISPGMAEAGMQIIRRARLYPDWPVARAVQTMYAGRTDPRPAQELSRLPELSTRWKRELLHTQQQQQQQQ